MARSSDYVVTSHWTTSMDNLCHVSVPTASFSRRLPLRLLALEESLEDSDNLVQRLQVLTQLLLNLCLVRSKLGVKILAVGARAHGGTEDWFYEEAVVRLKGNAVCVAEGIGKLMVMVGQVLAESNAGKLQTSVTHPKVSAHIFPSHEGYNILPD